MSAREMVKLIGREGLARIPMRSGVVLYVPVKIADVRSSYGRDDVMIVPVGGKGSAWVVASSVDVADEGFVGGILP
jgi:hypothetical protein